MVLFTDITYLPYNGTFAYLSSILDAFTMQILAYVVSESLEDDFVLETINLLIENHSITLYTETIVHLDLGCHYTSYRFINILKDKNFASLCPRKGNCWDNALQESFHGHMKDQISQKLKACTEFPEVKVIVDDYMDYYNNRRYQWELAKLAPNEFYPFYTTGIYPLDVPNKLNAPVPSKSAEEMGAGMESRDSTLDASASGQPLTE